MLNKKKAIGCKDYGIAITNYVLGEDLGMPVEELYTHLRNCKKCLDELIDWRDTYAVMRSEAYHKKPETQKKFQELLEKIKNLPVTEAEPLLSQPTETPINVEWEIGSAAGKIYDFLKGNGKVFIPVLRDKTGLVNYPFYEAIGWLAREEKVTLTKDKDGKPEYVSLNPEA